MRKVEKWLALPDDKLATELGRAFTEGPWKHCLSQNDSTGVTICCCSKCDKQWYVDDFPERKPCSFPGPIKLGWEEAMKWRDKIVKQNLEAWETALFDVCCTGRDTHDSNSRFLGGYSQPKHYLIAAAMAVEKSKT